MATSDDEGELILIQNAVEQGKSLALVTGATGFIGGRLVERLLEAGWRVRVLARNRTALSAQVQAECEVVVADLANVAVLQQAVALVDVVFHCAANVRTWDTWAAYEAANVQGMANLLAAMQDVCDLTRVRLLHISTVDVYGFPLHPCDELCAADGGEFAYGRSKWLGESLVRVCGDERGLRYTILRPANVIGAGSQFISRMGAELRSGVMLTIDGGRIHAGLTHVDNLIDAMLWAAHSDQAIRQCYNVRDDNHVTWGEFVRALRAGIGGKGVVLTLPFWLADTVASGFEQIYRLSGVRHEPLLHRLLVRLFGRTCGHSADKIRQHSGLVGKVSYADALAQSVQWFMLDRDKR